MVQTKRAKINSDTAVSIAHHHRPGSRPQGGFSPSYDPENEGAWDGQLPNPDLVDQFPPESPKPTAWPKVFDRLAWADGVVKARLYRNATAAVFHRITTRAGTPEGCTESVPNMALGLGLCRRAVQGAIKAIRADGYMNVLEQSGNTYICVPMMGKTVETLEGGRRCCTQKEFFF